MATAVTEVEALKEEAAEEQAQSEVREQQVGDESDRGKRPQLLKWLNNEFDYTRPRRGEVREALILEIGDNDIIVDCGTKQDGIVPRKDLDLLDEEYLESLEVGQTVPVAVLRTWGKQDGILVSINKGLQRQDWLRAETLLDSKEVIEAEVIDYNRGGVLVSFGRVRGFVPNSHLTSVPRGVRGQRLRELKAELVGEILSLVVIEVNQRRRRLVLSERKAGNVRRAQVLKELVEGDVRTATVSSIVDFGAFVDLGGIDGLVHISELDWTHVNHPSEVLSVGDKVEVYVLDVDRERERIALSRKRLLPDPWHKVTEDLNVGHVVEGTLANVVDFGAFVDLGQGVEGLVHVSEMPAGEATLQDLEPGSPISVRVLEIDDDRRRIALSLRGIAQTVSMSMPDDAAWDEWSEVEEEKDKAE